MAHSLATCAVHLGSTATAEEAPCPAVLELHQHPLSFRKHLLQWFCLDEVAIQALCKELRPGSWSLHHPLLAENSTFLKILATGSIQGVISEVLEMSQTSDSQCLHRFLDAMLVHLQEHVCFPTEKANVVPIRAGFTSFGSFPNMVRAMDCTDSPHHPLGQLHAYCNCHDCYSLKVQASCEH